MKKRLLIVLLLMLSITSVYSQNIILKNLSINDSNSNLGAALYGSNKMVYSSAIGGKLHLYSGTVSGDDVTGKQSFLEAKTQENVASFTNDLKTMYFTRSLYGEKNTVKTNKNVKARLAIFKATRTGNEWGNIMQLHFGRGKYDYAHPTLNADNTKLYFSSNMKGTNGKSDIFVVDILGKDSYSEPTNLGKSINTKGSELYPFISKENRLYFASNGHKGEGGLDIYSIDLNDTTKKPVHLSAPINSAYDDFAYMPIGDNKGYFTSNRPGGKGSDDVYLFKEKEEKEEKKEIKEELKKEKGCNQRLLGTVYINASQKVVQNALVQLKDETEKVIDTYQTNESARFIFKVKCNRTYKIIGSKVNYKTSERLMVTNGQDGILARKNIFLTKNSPKEGPAKRKEYIGRVDFEYNKTNLLRRYRYQLDKAILKMKQNKKLTIHFESHTDSRAPTDFNMELSRARIEVLKEYIGFKGIFRKRFSGEAFGESKPLNKCTKGVICTEEEYLLNRRTTFVLREGK